MAHSFIPALRFHWLTPVFDPFIARALPDLRIKADLVEHLQLADSSSILDFGCGSGTLALMIKRQYPLARVRGLDVDARILARARRKAVASPCELPFDRYGGSRFPYASDSFDAVVTSLAFHHLDDQRKRAALREINRVLKPGGALHVADFDRARNPVLGLIFEAVRLLDGRRNTRANAKGLLPKLIEQAGFTSVEKVARYETALGEVSTLEARKPLPGDRRPSFATPREALRGRRTHG
jgi:SAM-dependent methyltransferase